MARIETYAPPARLYRYRGFHDDTPFATFIRELDAIVQGHVYCPHFDQMNDPMEGLHSESALLQASPSYKATLEAVAAAKAQLGVASFSESHESEPMWAHYAADFHGMCVAYNLRRLLAGLDDTHVMARMAYNEKPPVLLKGRKSADEMARLALTTKTVRWMSEREWRLIRPTSGPATYTAEGCVEGVFLGSRISAAHEREVRARLEPLRIPIRKMVIRSYAIAWKIVVLPKPKPRPRAKVRRLKAV